MATTYKVLGQAAPSANSSTDIYTVPSVTQAVVSSVIICNRGNDAGQFIMAVRPAGASISNSHYISFNTNIPARDTISLSLGLSLGNTDVITVITTVGSLSYSIFGAEIS